MTLQNALKEIQNCQSRMKRDLHLSTSFHAPLVLVVHVAVLSDSHCCLTASLGQEERGTQTRQGRGTVSSYPLQVWPTSAAQHQLEGEVGPTGFKGMPNVVPVVKSPLANAGDTGLILGLGKSPEEETATHSSILAWKIPWTEEPGRLHTVHEVTKSWTQLSMRSQKVSDTSSTP